MIMTGKQMINTALVLLGYTNSVGDVSAEQRFRSRSLVVLNAIYSDLYYAQNNTGFDPLKSFDSEINLNERVLHDVMPYGVAMLLAESENDGDNQQLFSLKYNQKRLALTASNKIEDVIPIPE